MKIRSQFLIIAGIVTFSSAVFAEGLALPPCMAIKKACETVSKKGAFSDCSKKIMDGESVPGVVISSDVVAKCREKK